MSTRAVSPKYKRPLLTLAMTGAALLAIPGAHASTSVGNLSQESLSPRSNELRSNEVRSNASGFYPIWENTAEVESHQEIFIGTTGAQFGVLNRAQVGSNLLQFIYRTPNISGKFLLPSPASLSTWKFGVSATYFHLLESASESLFSPMYNSRITNPDFSIHLTSLQALATHQPNDWIRFHHSLTALSTVASGPLNSETYLGYSFVAELSGKRSHSLLLHATEVGFWKHDFSLLGLSYRYQGKVTELRAGYFYRMTRAGVEHSPLVGLGFAL